MRVAFSSANDQGQMDRPESGLFPTYDRSKFFAEIGRGPKAPTSAARPSSSRPAAGPLNGAG